MADLRQLRLDDLKAGFPGITIERCLSHLQACLVCLTKKHVSGINLEVKGNLPGIFQLIWQDKVTPQMLNTWNDPEEATEEAACAIAFLLILALTEFTIIQRSRKGTGFDYWLGYKTAVVFERTARLEISGMLNATETDVLSRVRRKLKQVEASDDSGLPVYIVVVEFSKPLAYVVKK
jgi:hypothetical protein